MIRNSYKFNNFLIEKKIKFFLNIQEIITSIFFILLIIKGDFR